MSSGYAQNQGSPGYGRPSERPLQVFALDPMRINRGKAGMVTPRVTLYPPYESDVQVGPRGHRIHVIDYDGVQGCFYEPIDLDHPDVLIRNGLRPSESDPRFHQQMVYAVVASLWADFETALGRRVSLGRKRILRIFPHAFYGQNAYYDPSKGALLFGYFQADTENPGENMPGQMVFTCLSHDIIVHETTHALVDRLRPDFMYDTNPDVLAFHEGFSDLVAIFQHFKMRELLEAELAGSGGELSKSDALLSLARQFGYSTGQGMALRSARSEGGPDAATYRNSYEPHQRGAVLVRAVFDAFLALYDQRTQDLLRLASGGSGILAAGALHPDLVHRLANEASDLADQMFTALIRAFDYLPPVDVTFEDLLRSLVSVDRALSPADDTFRVAVIEGFRRYGIFPTSAGSLDDNAVAWQAEVAIEELLPVHKSALAETISDLDDINLCGFDAADSDATTDRADWSPWARELHAFASRHRRALGLIVDLPFQVAGMHPTVRYRASGRPTVDVVVRYIQRRPDLEVDEFIPKGGCTVVADIDGRIHTVVARQPPADVEAAKGELSLRLDAARHRDSGAAYRDDPPKDRLRIRFAQLHSDPQDWQ